MNEHDRMPEIRMPEIEPLSDLSWKRVEDGVFARLDADAAAPPQARSSFDRRWAIAGALVACAAAVLVFVVTRGGDETTTALNRTSHVAAHDSASQVTIGDVSLTVEPHSAVLMTEHDHGADIVLERGSVRCAVAPQKPGNMIRVLAGEVTVRVVGTIFAVSRTGDTASVSVERGEVEVVFRGDRVAVAAGETWPAPKSAMAEPEAAEPEAAEPEAAEPEVAMEPDVLPRQDGKRPARKPRSKPAPAPEPTAKQRFAAAAELEASDPAAAIEDYTELARDGGAWAAPALFAKGRLELDVGRKAAGTRTLERYLARFPNGANAADARALLRGLK